MMGLAVNGYDEDDVRNALRGFFMPPVFRQRAVLLDQDLVELYQLEGLRLEGSRIFNDSTQPIKRGAELQFIETLRDGNHAAELLAFAEHITAQGRLVHWRFGESSGNFADFTGNARTLTANGTITYGVASLVAGDLTNNAIKPNGTTGYGSIADAAWMDVAGGLSVVCAVKGTSASKAFVNRDDGASNRFHSLEVDSSGYLTWFLNFTTGSPTHRTVNTNTAINDGLPHLIHAIYDKERGQIKIYIDGNNVLPPTSETRALATGTLGIRVGSSAASGGSKFSDYTHDETGILDRALTPREIRDEYQAWSDQLAELLVDKDYGDRIKILDGVKMPTVGTDGSGYAEWPQIVAVRGSLKTENVETDTYINITGQDQTQILASGTFADRYSVAAATNFVTAVVTICQSAGFDTSGWSIEPTSNTTLSAIEFESDSSYLDAVNYLLKSNNYRDIEFDGQGGGVIARNILDVNRASSETFQNNDESLILYGVADERRPRKAINEVVVYNGAFDTTPIAQEWTNARAISAVSTRNLRRTYQLKVQLDVPSSGVALDVAKQVLTEETQKVEDILSWPLTRWPLFENRDIITAINDRLNINGEYLVLNWTLPLMPTQNMELSIVKVVDVVS